MASRPFIERFTEKYTISDGCWVWIAHIATNGYGQISDSDGKVRSAHCIAWELANGRPIPKGMLVRHKCDNRPCVRPDHLELGTHKDNSDDKFARGRHVIGRAPGTKLSEDDVRDIRERYVRRYEPTRGPWRSNARELADEFNVHPMHIHAIVRRDDRIYVD